MKRYDIKCPICGTLNRNLDLEETNGWMECEKCGNATQRIVEHPKVRILSMILNTFLSNNT